MLRSSGFLLRRLVSPCEHFLDGVRVRLQLAVEAGADTYPAAGSPLLNEHKAGNCAGEKKPEA